MDDGFNVSLIANRREKVLKRIPNSCTQYFRVLIMKFFIFVILTQLQVFSLYISENVNNFDNENLESAVKFNFTTKDVSFDNLL